MDENIIEVNYKGDGMKYTGHRNGDDCRKHICKECQHHVTSGDDLPCLLCWVLDQERNGVCFWVDANDTSANTGG
jgi:hypothetical protein